MATQTSTETGFTTVELLTLAGPEFRRVSTAPPRDATLDEIPVIDLSNIRGTLEQKKELAARVRNAAQGSGFFYIKNHGISETIVQNALKQSKAFFGQSPQTKKTAYVDQLSIGYTQSGSSQINRSESRDSKENFSWRYDPKYDPLVDDITAASPASNPPLRGDDSIWEKMAHLPGFKDDSLLWWQSCLSLARQLTRIFALALDLPEDYFDSITTHPGADGLFIHYPATEDLSPDLKSEVGIGSHTDIQCFTILWQDMSGGLQVLSSQNEWLKATPIEGTFVVNIGDFLQRLSNNTFKSTVHRVWNRQSVSRYSMPFFFGFNYDAICSVVSTCTDENHPPLYEPISCGKWRQDRLNLAKHKGK